MATPAKLLERIETGPAMGQPPTIRGTDVRVTEVYRLIEAGMDIPEVLDLMPELVRDDVLAVMFYTMRSGKASVA